MLEQQVATSVNATGDDQALDTGAARFHAYLDLYPDPVSGGGLAPINVAIWSTLLAAQEAVEVRGNLMEIGVWYGHGSVLPAMFRRDDERLILIDKYMSPEHSRPNLEKITPDIESAIDFFQGDTFSLRRRRALDGFADSVRWAHIDGEHSFEAVVNDLDIVANAASEGAIVVLDDFFNFSCPSCTEGAFHWLQRNPEKLCLFLCGFNKAYLCSPRNLRQYIRVVHDLPNRLTGMGFDTMLCMSGWSAERPYFGLDYSLPGKRYQQIGKALDNATLDELFFGSI